jgi:hypothetical protein
MSSVRPPLSLTDFAEELVAAFGARATASTIALMLSAREQGLTQQQDVLTSAAIMLCGSKYRLS